MTLPGMLALLVERRHHHDRRPARRAEAVRVPAQFGLGKPTGEGMPGEAAGPAAAAGGLERLGARLDPDRAQRRRHAAADGRRVRRDRQRRHVGAAAPGQGDDRAGRHADARAARRRPGRCSARRTRPRCAPCWRRSTTVDRRDRPLGARSPATGSPARPAPASGSSTASTPPARWPRSSAWRRRTNPRYVIAVFAHTPGGGGGDVAAPAFTRDDGVHAAALPGAADRRRSRPKFTVYPVSDARRHRECRRATGGCAARTGRG